jgi:hypothetical protein
MPRTLVRTATVASAVLAAAVISAGPAAAARGNPGVPAGVALEFANARSVVSYCVNDPGQHPGVHAGWDEDSPVVERRNVGGICGGPVLPAG